MRVLFFIGVLFTALYAPFPIFVCGALLYALWFSGIELLIVGMYIDVQFGHLGMTTEFLYTAVTGLILFCVESLKPYVRFYKTKHESF